MAINQAYEDFIQSDRWDELRKARIKIAKNRCENCRKYKPLQVHHKTYERFGGRERMDDLLALCFSCHEIFDRKRRNGQSQNVSYKPVVIQAKKITVVINVSCADGWGSYEAEIIESKNKTTRLHAKSGITTANQMMLKGIIAVLKVLPNGKIITLTKKNRYNGTECQDC